MNASVIFFIACLFHINIFFGNSTHHDNEESDEYDMSYLECTNAGCQLVKASINELPKPEPWVVENEEESNGVHSRSKRRMFFPDNRLRLREKNIGRYPFNSAVAIRVNGVVTCSGVALVKPKFFLTAAHCVHPDGKLKGKPFIEVGVLHKYGEMQWDEVEVIRVPSIWSSTRKYKKKYLRLKDYAVVKTKTKDLPVTPMNITSIRDDMLQVNRTYMYLSAFDNEKNSDDLYMRFCRIRKTGFYEIYSQCDTVSRTAGAGIYLRMRNEKGEVERKVFAIATGGYGVKADEEYSVALRISTRMHAHICKIVTGAYSC